jgi:hypothetical protein
VAPHVVGLEEQAVDEAAAYGSLEAIEVIISVVSLVAKRSETRERPAFPSRGRSRWWCIAEQVMAFPADVIDFGHCIVRKLLPHHEVQFS